MPVIAAMRIRIGADVLLWMHAAFEIPAAHTQAGEYRQHRADNDPSIHAVSPAPTIAALPPPRHHPYASKNRHFPGRLRGRRKGRRQTIIKRNVARDTAFPSVIIRTRPPNPASLAGWK